MSQAAPSPAQLRAAWNLLQRLENLPAPWELHLRKSTESNRQFDYCDDCFFSLLTEADWDGVDEVISSYPTLARTLLAFVQSMEKETA